MGTEIGFRIIEGDVSPHRSTCETYASLRSPFRRERHRALTRRWVLG